MPLISVNIVETPTTEDIIPSHQTLFSQQYLQPHNPSIIIYYCTMRSRKTGLTINLAGSENINELSLHKIGKVLLQIVIAECGPDINNSSENNPHQNHFLAKLRTSKDIIGRVKTGFDAVVDCCGEINHYLNVGEILELGKMKNFA